VTESDIGSIVDIDFDRVPVFINVSDLFARGADIECPFEVFHSFEDLAGIPDDDIPEEEYQKALEKGFLPVKGCWWSIEKNCREIEEFIKPEDNDYGGESNGFIHQDNFCDSLLVVSVHVVSPP
jgi:hypothetical protein